MKPEDNQGIMRIRHLYRAGGMTPVIASFFNAESAQHMAYIRSVMREQRKQPLYRMELASLSAAAVDLETTGFSPYHGDEIIAVGAALVDGDRVQEEPSFYSAVKPGRRIPAHIEKLTGLTNEGAANAPHLLPVLRRLIAFVGDRVLLVHGSGHDKRFLQAALWKTSKTALRHRLLDTMVIGRWLKPEQRDLSLDAALETYGIPPIGRHHALSDAVLTGKLWLRQCEEIRERHVLSLGDLYSRLSVYL